MPRYIVKPDRDIDFYVVWSTVVDNAVLVGVRQGLLSDPEFTEDRLLRADTYGTSARNKQFGWNDEELVVHNDPVVGCGYLKRRDLKEYVLLSMKKELQKASELLSPLGDD